MRPLSPAERAAILAEHPGTTEADLDRLLGLMAQRFQPAAPSGAAAAVRRRGAGGEGAGGRRGGGARRGAVPAHGRGDPAGGRER